MAFVPLDIRPQKAWPWPSHASEIWKYLRASLKALPSLALLHGHWSLFPSSGLTPAGSDLQCISSLTAACRPAGCCSSRGPAVGHLPGRVAPATAQGLGSGHPARYEDPTLGPGTCPLLPRLWPVSRKLSENGHCPEDRQPQGRGLQLASYQHV